MAHSDYLAKWRVPSGSTTRGLTASPPFREASIFALETLDCPSLLL